MYLGDNNKKLGNKEHLLCYNGKMTATSLITGSHLYAPVYKTNQWKE